MLQPPGMGVQVVEGRVECDGGESDNWEGYVRRVIIRQLTII